MFIVLHETLKTSIMASSCNTQDLLDFQTFEHVMLNSDIDDIHKYYDDDGEVDLEDNYAGESEEEEEEEELDLIESMEHQLMTDHRKPVNQGKLCCPPWYAVN